MAITRLSRRNSMSSGARVLSIQKLSGLGRSKGNHMPRSGGKAGRCIRPICCC